MNLLTFLDDLAPIVGGMTMSFLLIAGREAAEEPLTMRLQGTPTRRQFSRGYFRSGFVLVLAWLPAVMGGFAPLKRGVMSCRNDAMQGISGDDRQWGVTSATEATRKA